MSSLTDLTLPKTLDTSTADIIEDFFVPVLAHAVRYHRGVGFFSSGWLRATAKGMVEFAANGGRGRWVTSPILSRTDWEALQAGDAARYDPVLRAALARNIDDLARVLEEETLSALAWMVADQILTFKLTLPQHKLSGGEFHDKFGIFSDAKGNQLSFNGSYNESIQGTRNYESIKIFCSWEEAFAPLVQADIQRFEQLWSNQDSNVRVFDLPDAAREQILRLRTQERPYPEPEWIGLQRIVEEKTQYKTEQMSRFQLWQHQEDAITAWEQNNRIGLLSMATGSGKTLTAISAAKRCPNLTLLVIAVPRNNLVDQWTEEIRKFTNFEDSILIYENSSKWQDRLFNKLRISHRTKWKKPLVVIGSMKSLSSKRFLSVLDDAGIPSNALIIVDEVHNVGARTYRRVLLSEFAWRLGLSATPERSFDEEGTRAIEHYFQRLVFVYDMAQALRDGRLCPYSYFVYAVPLSMEEYKEYNKLTRQIIALRDNTEPAVTWQSNDLLGNDTKDIEQLLFKRARILKKCTAKSEIVSQILQDHPPTRCLVYCADNEQLDIVHEILNEEQIIHLKYVSQTPKEQRASALNAIGRGHVPVLLAIDCLDEGVDVPTVESAVILASSSNKRQFIQRRGRILRRSEEKDMATLVDVIAVPPFEVGHQGKRMLRGELTRAKEMAELAENRTAALLQIKSYTEIYGVYLTELLSEGKGEFYAGSNTV